MNAKTLKIVKYLSVLVILPILATGLFVALGAPKANACYGGYGCGYGGYGYYGGGYPYYGNYGYGNGYGNGYWGGYWNGGHHHHHGWGGGWYR